MDQEFKEVRDNFAARGKAAFLEHEHFLAVHFDNYMSAVGRGQFGSERDSVSFTSVDVLGRNEGVFPEIVEVVATTS